MSELDKSKLGRIEVPVTMNYDSSKVIGRLSIMVAGQKLDDMILAPEILVKEVQDDGTITDAELISVSLIPAKNLKK